MKPEGSAKQRMGHFKQTSLTTSCICQIVGTYVYFTSEVYVHTNQAKSSHEYFTLGGRRNHANFRRQFIQLGISLPSPAPRVQFHSKIYQTKIFLVASPYTFNYYPLLNRFFFQSKQEKNMYGIETTHPTRIYTSQPFLGRSCQNKLMRSNNFEVNIPVTMCIEVEARENNCENKMTL